MKERDQQLPDFFRFTEIGQAIGGTVAKFGRGKHNDFVVFSPAIVRQSSSAPWERYETLAVNISAGMANVMNIPADRGKDVALAYADNKDTGKATPMKVFRVFDFEAGELQKMISRAKPGAPIPQGRGNAEGNAAAQDDDEELPF